MNPLKSFFRKDVLLHPLSLASFGAVIVIALGSVAYYAIATRAPSDVWQRPSMGPITEVVTGTGSVEPAENPDLAFQSGGRVANVAVSVGNSVTAGETLASLDIAALSAQQAQAQADVAAAQAQLDEMQAPPRAVDVAAKQTAIDQAQAELQNVYASVSANIAQAYDKSFSGVSQSTDTLFNQPDSTTPTLAFTTTNSELANEAGLERTAANNELAAWKGESDALTESTPPTQLDAALIAALGHLSVLREYNDTLLSALDAATPSSAFPQSSITAAQASLGGLRDTINSLILTLQGLQQQVTNDGLAVQSAQDALNQTNASSTPQDIEAQEAGVEAAQANVENIDAQISDALIVAPYAGKVTSVAVKTGQIVAPDTTAVSLTPLGALQAVIYLTEVDVAKLAVGDSAEVTLDAYGTGRVFPATVVSIDSSPTMQNGVPGYKVTLQFGNDDPAIAAGMTANAEITAAHKDSALIIPQSAVVQNGDSDFVLVSSAQGPVERPVVLGLISTSTDEIVSGLSVDDQILISTK